MLADKLEEALTDQYEDDPVQVSDGLIDDIIIMGQID